MKKKELKKRIADGFSELAPDIFEAVLETAEEQKLFKMKTEAEKTPVQTTDEKEMQYQEQTVRGKKISRMDKTGKERYFKYALSACASMALFLLCIFSGMMGEQKAIYLTLDINPSIQIKMNESFQVKSVTGLNQDGKDVVREIRWKKKEPVQEVLDDVLEDVVEKSYLNEDGAILVTLYAENEGVCDDLTAQLCEGIGRKLTELEVFNVTIAFQNAHDSSAKEGRRQLEEELMKSCGLLNEQIQQMSVSELISYCQEHMVSGLKIESGEKEEKESDKKQWNRSSTVNGTVSDTEMRQETKVEKKDQELDAGQKNPVEEENRAAASKEREDLNGSESRSLDEGEKSGNNQNDPEVERGAKAENAEEPTNPPNTEAPTQQSEVDEQPKTEDASVPTDVEYTEGIAQPDEVKNKDKVKSKKKSKGKGKDKAKNKKKDKDKAKGKDKAKDKGKEKVKGKDKNEDKAKGEDKEQDKDKAKDLEKENGKSNSNLNKPSDNENGEKETQEMDGIVGN